MCLILAILTDKIKIFVYKFACYFTNSLVDSGSNKQLINEFDKNLKVMIMTFIIRPNKYCLFTISDIKETLL